MLKVSAFYLEKQKSFIPKKNFFRPQSLNMPREIQKMSFAVLIFSEGFVRNMAKLQNKWHNTFVVYFSLILFILVHCVMGLHSEFSSFLCTYKTTYQNIFVTRFDDFSVLPYSAQSFAQFFDLNKLTCSLFSIAQSLQIPSSALRGPSVL